MSNEKVVTKSFLDPKILLSADSTGLSDVQKTALISAWSILRKDIVSYSKQIFIQFFELYPEYIEYFDISLHRDVKLDQNMALHAHVISVFHKIGNLIDYGIRSPKVFDCMIARIVKYHEKLDENKKVTQSDIQKMGQVIIDYFSEKLERQSTDTLLEAFEILFYKISVAFGN